MASQDDDLLPDPLADLRLEVDARPTDVGDIIEQLPRIHAYTAAVASAAQQLMDAKNPSRIQDVLRRIFEVVTAAHRISLVDWPPESDGTLTHRVPPATVDARRVIGGPISRSLAAQAVETRRALFFSREMGMGRLTQSTSVQALNIRSAVYVPLVDAEDRVMAVLCVDTPQPARPFLPADFHFIRAVASLLAASLAGERMHEEVRKKELQAREYEIRRETMEAFLRIASHDLRNPLSIIQLATDELRLEQDERERGLLLDEIVRAVNRARQLIKSYLQSAALRGGQALDVVAERVDPRRLADDEFSFVAKSLSGPEAPALSNELEPAPIWADPEKLGQIFANLFLNAIKYSPGGARIRVWSDLGQDGPTYHVSDQGQGIPAPDLDRIFGAFERGCGSRAEGTGLGLWLTRLLVEAHGGRIWVASEPGRGSTFSFTLPHASGGDPRA